MKSDSSQLTIISTISTYEELLLLCTQPKIRILFYDEIHKYLIKTIRTTIVDQDNACRYLSCYDIINTLMYTYSPVWEHVPHRGREKIYKQFIELLSRRPFLHWLMCKLYPWQDHYRYWGSSFYSHLRRLIVINECISECLKAMLWEQQQKQ